MSELSRLSNVYHLYLRRFQFYQNLSEGHHRSTYQSQTNHKLNQSKFFWDWRME